MKQLRTYFSRRPFVYGFLLGLVAVTLLAFLFEWQNGAHPECALNDSVGPCDVPGRVQMYWPLIVYVALGIGAMSTSLKLWLAGKKRTKKTAKNQVRNLEKARLYMWLSLSFWMVVPFGLFSVFLFVVAPVVDFLGFSIGDIIFIPVAIFMQTLTTLGWILPLVFGYRYWRLKRGKK
ncbi:hypothetical protein KA047_03710 [Candidatus Saccharibacteria bacterium]|nr:hypothetical protein [Candidatus Saccharibacteria bacterium]